MSASGSESAATCRGVTDLVTDYFEGDLDDLTTRRLEEHVAACARCAGYLGQMRATTRLLGDVPAGGSLSPRARGRLLAAFHVWRDRPRTDGGGSEWRERGRR